jgi:hypothetical protein
MLGPQGWLDVDYDRALEVARSETRAYNFVDCLSGVIAIRSGWAKLAASLNPEQERRR